MGIKGRVPQGQTPATKLSTCEGELKTFSAPREKLNKSTAANMFSFACGAGARGMKNARMWGHRFFLHDFRELLRPENMWQRSSCMKTLRVAFIRSYGYSGDSKILKVSEA